MNKYEIRYYNYSAQEYQLDYILAKDEKDAMTLFTLKHGWNPDVLEGVYEYCEPNFETKEKILDRLNSRVDRKLIITSRLNKFEEEYKKYEEFNAQYE